MPSFLVDEDLPVSLADALRAAGLATKHVREVGLRGASDETVIARARHGNDPEAIVRALRKASEDGGRKVVSLPPRPLSVDERDRKAGSNGRRG